jgi:inhibitor of cysteine peptidase
MKTYLRFLYVSLVIVLVMAFPLKNAQGGGKVEGGMPNMTVTEKENNSTVEVNKGDVLAVMLEFSPGTGYSWQIVRNDSKLMEPQGEPVFSGGPEQQKLVGGKEQATFSFKAVNSGTGVIELQHKRGWEKEKEPLKVFSITVKIK